MEEKEKIYECMNCNKKTIWNTKFKLNKFPFLWSLGCSECGELFYY